MKTYLLTLLALFLTVPTVAQDDQSTTFYRVTKLHDKGDLMKVENTMMLPYFQEQVNNGNQIWHALYRIASPNGEEADADYVSVDAFSSLGDAMPSEEESMKRMQAVFPDGDAHAFRERLDKHSKVQGTRFYEVVTAIPFKEYAAGEPQPRMVVVNYMEVPPRRGSDFEAMEKEVMNPFMEAHQKRGNMEGWLVASRVLPGGSGFGANYITADIYLDVDQMMQRIKNNQEVGKATHPNLDIEKWTERVHTNREIVSRELWELQTETTPPATEEVAYKVVKEGEGPKPKRGQEIAWRGQILNPAGEVLMTTDDLGMLAYDIVGDDPFDPMISRAARMVGKGGIVTVRIPASQQSYQQQQQTGGEDRIYKLELKEIGPPVANGTRKLHDMLTSKGLEAAREWYQKVQKNNPENYVFRESSMNALGYDLMGKGMEREAIYVLDLNRQNFPDSFNVYDSLADAYRNAGDDYHAMKHYEMALKKNPDSDASAEKLAELK